MTTPNWTDAHGAITAYPDTDSLWRHIEAITGGHVNVRSDYGRGYTATHNGHHGDQQGETPYQALVLLAEQMQLPETSEEWEAQCRARSDAWWEEWEASPPIPNPYPDIDSVTMLGLDRGKLGDWLQEVHDAGWYIDIEQTFVRVWHPLIAEYDGTDDDTHRIDIAFVRAYLAWRGREVSV